MSTICRAPTLRQTPHMCCIRPSPTAARALFALILDRRRWHDHRSEGGARPRSRPDAEADRRLVGRAGIVAIARRLQRLGGTDVADNRNGHRDGTMVLLAYRHGLRPIELVTLRWDAVDFAHGQIHVSRAKRGSPSVHPLSGVELRALRRLKREQEPSSPFVFTSERGAPFTTAGWRKMVARLGVAAKLGFKTHPHMLRHACGFQLANQGTDTRTLQAYLGHRNIQHTVRYTELSPTRFKNLWRE